MIVPDDSFWKRKQEKSLKRKVCVRKLRDVFLIVCEGTKTEPNYFRSFRLTSSYVKDVFGIGDNTEEVVRRTIKFKNSAARYRNFFARLTSSGLPAYRQAGMTTSEAAGNSKERPAFQAV